MGNSGFKFEGFGVQDPALCWGLGFRFQGLERPVEFWGSGFQQVSGLDLQTFQTYLQPYTLNLGYCPHPVTVYIRGPIKGYV